MFKIKSSKNGKHHSVGIADKASEGIKSVEEQLKNLKKFIIKHDDKHKFNHASKEAGMTLAAILGAGLIVYGVYKILHK